MTRRRLGLAALVSAFAVTAAPAQGPADGGGPLAPTPGPTLDPAAIEAASEFRRLRLEPRDNYRRVKRVVRGLDWHDDLDDALEEAAATGRPLVWIQALGDVNGFT